MIKRMLLVVVVLALHALPSSVFANGGVPLVATLSGAAEAPGPGDPDGTGYAMFTLNYGKGEVCWTVSYENIDAPRAAHIHRAPAGSPGPVVVPLSPITGNCATVNQDLIKEIIQNPEEFYVNVHNPAFPAGAIRGQLTRPGLDQ